MTSSPDVTAAGRGERLPEFAYSRDLSPGGSMPESPGNGAAASFPGITKTRESAECGSGDRGETVQREHRAGGQPGPANSNRGGHCGFRAELLRDVTIRQRCLRDCRLVGLRRQVELALEWVLVAVASVASPTRLFPSIPAPLASQRCPVGGESADGRAWLTGRGRGSQTSNLRGAPRESLAGRRCL
jgi:hypothetical protein